MKTIFRSRKSKGKQVTYPIRKSGQQYAEEYETNLNGKVREGLLQIAGEINSRLSVTDAGNTSINDKLDGMHRLFLNGMNLELLHDISIENPIFEANLLKAIAGSTGDREPISNLYIFDGSKISGMVNILRAQKPDIPPDKAGEKSSAENLTRLARLQVFPLTQHIYMSLTTKGNFFYREGSILIPYNRLTASGLSREVLELAKEENIQKMIDRLSEFNAYLAKEYDREENVKDSGRMDIGIVPVPGMFGQVKVGDRAPWGADNGEGSMILQFAGEGNRGKNRDDQKKDDDNKPFGQIGALFKADTGILDNDDYRSFQGRVNKDLLAGKEHGNPFGALSDIYLYGYTTGIDPSIIIEDLNESRLNEENRELLERVKAFSDRGLNRKVKDVDRIIGAFVKYRRLKDVPSNAKEFYALINDENSALGSAIKSSWKEFIDPSNFEAAAKVIQKYSDEDRF